VKEVWAVIHEPHAGKDLTGIRLATHHLPDLHDRASWALFFLEAAGLAGWSFLRWIGGAWWAPLALPHLIDLRYSRRVRSGDLPLQVAFHSVQKSVRPLWTCDLERRGARVLMFLYSMNNVAFAPRSVGHKFSEPDFHQVSWPEYVVWGELHAAMLKKAGVRKGRFTYVGAMGFADDLSDEPALPSRCVAVFDVEAHRLVDLAIQGIPRPYWDHETCHLFVEQAFAAIRALGATPVYKPKGYLRGRFFRPNASAFLDLIKRYDVIVVDGYVNANRVIPKVDAVLSMPFTSTAAAALALRRPTAYFDPTGTLAPFAELACGIPLILSRVELKSWLIANMPASSEPSRRQLVQ
jgi:polysaccharide biosynthesis PFTS motif protein